MPMHRGETYEGTVRRPPSASQEVILKETKASNTLILDLQSPEL